MVELEFKPVDIEDIDRIYKYTSLFGEGSCQHSPVSMYSLYDKYGDSICIQDGFLYTLRNALCDDKYRVYLAPFGDSDLKKAYKCLIDDAHIHGKKIKFYTLTAAQKSFICNEFAGMFDVCETRDLSEYIYAKETFEAFPGKRHARRRTEIRSFWRDYKDRTTIEPLTAEDLDEVLAFTKDWLINNVDTHDVDALKKELKGIKKHIGNYEKLKLTGTLIRIDGDIEAFCYGTGLNDEYYDVLIEKGNRDIPGIYRVLRQESTKLNLNGYKYVNFEEDVGDTGLRKVKESYGPEFMIDKYIVTEK